MDKQRGVKGNMPVEIVPAYGRIAEIKALFNEYTQSLGLDLTFQHYQEELDSLPGKYAQPQGRLYLALLEGEVAGCIGLRPMDREGCCEMKRLYVRSRFRGHHIGSLLARQVVADAGEIGYKQMLLDTLPTMKSAVGMYRAMGFYDIQPYYDNPISGAIYLCLDLPAGGQGDKNTK